MATPKHSKYSELRKLIEKFADYCACDEYHYGRIDGRPGNHDPKDGHMEFDEEEFETALTAYINKEKATARMEQIDELIDLEPEKQFMHWKPQDIANFFYRVGRIRRQLEAQLASEGDYEKTM